jgi:hypothetical protein
MALAEEIESDDPECAALVALATTRLHSAHSLVGVLRRGVGFHHAALPGDVQAELEDGIRKGPLRYLVATTTLIEGINFPVRSVLVGDRGYPTADGFVTTLDAPKLLNAVGRAGRAGRETEGWIVLSFNKESSPQDFAPLSADDEDLTASSRLSTNDALEALATFEEVVRQGQDAIMQTDEGAAADFVGHVWFVANALSELELATADPVRLSIESTLAWQQLDERTRERWRSDRCACGAPLLGDAGRKSKAAASYGNLNTERRAASISRPMRPRPSAGMDGTQGPSQHSLTAAAHRAMVHAAWTSPEAPWSGRRRPTPGPRRSWTSAVDEGWTRTRSLVQGRGPRTLWTGASGTLVGPADHGAGARWPPAPGLRLDLGIARETTRQTVWLIDDSD